MTLGPENPNVRMEEYHERARDPQISWVNSPTPWRAGTKIPLNIYDADNRPIGVMYMSEADARLVVQLVNAYMVPFSGQGDSP